jgi:transposase
MIFDKWVVGQLQAKKKKVLVLVWDNASWHKSKQVLSWIKEHNKKVKKLGGVRLLKCFLPIKSPWLNPIEPRWVHAKRSIVEPINVLSSNDLISRVCSYFNNPILDLLKQDLL